MAELQQLEEEEAAEVACFETELATQSAPQVRMFARAAFVLIDVNGDGTLNRMEVLSLH